MWRGARVLSLNWHRRCEAGVTGVVGLDSRQHISSTTYFFESGAGCRQRGLAVAGVKSLQRHGSPLLPGRRHSVLASIAGVSASGCTVIMSLLRVPLVTLCHVWAWLFCSVASPLTHHLGPSWSLWIRPVSMSLTLGYCTACESMDGTKRTNELSSQCG